MPEHARNYLAPERVKVTSGMLDRFAADVLAERNLGVDPILWG